MKMPNIIQKALSSIRASGVAGSFWGRIHEPFAGAYQRNMEIDSRETLLAFSAVFSCTTGIASDIAKLQPRIMSKTSQGIWEVNLTSPYARLLKKPNHYQTRLKFIEQWIICKLLHGNAYILKSRDQSGRVIALYVLDPTRVVPMVSDTGDIYYQLSRDDLSLTDTDIVPASEIIHDTMVCLFHPLVGVSPIYACGRSASMGNAIQVNTQALFKNRSQPGGMLTAPAKISDEAASRIKAHWDTKFQGDSTGKIAVLGDGLKYEQLTMNAVDAQLIDQLKWSVEDVARAFRYPMYKLGAGSTPISNNVEMLGLEYYSGCLQPLIESLELLLDSGLDLRNDECVELDTKGLMRMDTGALYKANSDAISGGWMAPNEARKEANLPPVDGGDSPMVQQQNYSLEDLAKLRQSEFAPKAIDDPETETEELIKRIRKGLNA